jgi:hypothetical protein
MAVNENLEFFVGKKTQAAYTKKRFLKLALHYAGETKDGTWQIYKVTSEHEEDIRFVEEYK